MKEPKEPSLYDICIGEYEVATTGSWVDRYGVLRLDPFLDPFVDEAKKKDTTDLWVNRSSH